MFDDKETEKRLTTAFQRVIRGIVTADEENADLIRADMQMIKNELIPVALNHEDEHIRELGTILQRQMERFGL